MSSLAINIKKEREKMTQDEVAEKSNISRSYYTHIENGTKEPTVKVAKDIAHVLGFNWTNFFNYECSLEEQSE